ncbi:MAG: autotransporter outer membrane beta-barrel domain-containing protein [Rhizomicrobium sp.]
MNKIVSRLMSGASLALLSFGVPSFARAGSTAFQVLRALPSVQRSALDNGLSTLYFDHILVDKGLLLGDEASIENAVGSDETKLFGDHGDFIAVAGLVSAASHSASAAHNHATAKLGVGGDRLDILLDEGAVDYVLVGTGTHAGAGTHIATELYGDYYDQPVPPHIIATGSHLHPHFTPAAVATTKIAIVSQTSTLNNYSNHNDHFKGVALAAHAGSANATAWPVYQDAVGLGPLENYVDNTSGRIEAFAGAWRAGVANAYAYGIYQNAHSFSSKAHNTVDNGIGAFIGAGAIAGDAYTANAHAAGVRQVMNADYVAKNYVSNLGTIEAFASAHDAAYTAHAEAAGVYQDPHGTNVYNVVTNAGHIGADAFVHHAGTGYARATGVFQSGIGIVAAHNTVENYDGGQIVAFASVNDVEYAYANAVGVGQGARAASAYNEVANHGLIAAGALATETGAEIAKATALAVSQEATGAHAFNAVQNTKDGEIIAGAAASSAIEGVYANAAGVHQTANGAIAAHNAVTNYGLIEAGAFAHTGFSMAAAHATGVYQSAAGTAGGTGHNKVANYGTSKEGIVAVAWASDAYDVKAVAFGVHQTASGAAAYNSVTNHGFIGAFARADDAYRSTDGLHGTAWASAIGVLQTAGRYEAAAKATNIVHNAEVDSTIAAVAWAYDAVDATARAAGIAQYADGGTLANNSVTNHGHIVAGAYAEPAYANDGSDYRVANAHAWGVYQTANASGPAANAVHNYSKADIVALAYATHAYDNHATATGVRQSAIANGGYNAGNLVVNDGFIGASAVAHGGLYEIIPGHQAAYTADAYATGVHQKASGIDAQNAVTNQNIDGNKGAILAFAAAASAYDVSAVAKGVNQYAHDGAMASNLVNNSGLIGASAKAHGFYYSADFHGDFAYAHAYGVSQYAGGSNAHNAVNNFASAYIVAAASAYDAEFAYAEAKGINQVAFGKTAANSVYNAGLIAAGAYAGDAFLASARAYGIDQHATDAKNGVTNYGIVVAGAAAISAEFAYAEAKGVNQIANGVDAANSVYNAGLIAATAHAAGVEEAIARAYGVDQRASGHTANNTVDNYGTIAAFASAHGFVGPYAEAKGVNQDAHGTHYATNTVVNGGLIYASAWAHGGVYATANAYGVDQHAGAHSAANFVNNFKGGNIVASAYATGADHENALAKGVNQHAYGYLAGNAVANSGLIAAAAFATHYVEAATADARAYGIDQHAGANTAHNVVTNYASGAIAALALATSAHHANAEAKGVNQDAGAYIAHNAVDNAGLIWASAIAYGVGNDTASARAYGVDQHAGAYSALNGVYNSGHIVAFASASNAYDVTAEAKGVNQRAYGAFATNQVTNYHGLIVGAAIADGAYAASARAYGIDQQAHGDPAYNTVNNLGGTIAAQAAAFDAGYATAGAKAINQEAYAHGGTAANYVVNSGLIAASAHAYNAGNASARAYGIDQHVGAYSALNSVVNNGGDIAAFAVASHAYSANAEAKGVNQRAGGYTAANHVINDGGLIWASAVAQGGYHAHSANAFAYGVDQHVGAFTAHNSAYNSGYIVAIASASHAEYVDAGARGVYQRAGAYTAHNAVTNYDGLIYASAIADHGRSVSATARGIDQHAHGDLGAYNTVHSNGTIIAYANAYHAEDATANAKGIDQHASASHADNVVYNDQGGLIAAFAFASQAYDANATAKGVDQHAYADGASGLNGNGVNNTGYIAASAFAGHAYSANARAYGVDQHVEASNLPFNLVNNGGLIEAFAGATDAAYARAEAKGVNQRAYGNSDSSVANNVVANSGYIIADAVAHGFLGYTADARAYGIDQHAEAGSGAHNHVVNSGTVLAFASASYAEHANAEAKGINQRAYGFTAVNFVSNLGDGGFIVASAYAHDATTANARAYGIDQHAGAYQAQNTVVNHGSLTSAGHYFAGGVIAASARATAGEYLHAEAKGVNQQAGAYTALNNHVTNDAGLIEGYAVAHGYVSHSSKGAVIGTEAASEASARAYGVDQHAGAFNAHNAVVNSGTIRATATASHAYSATAEAKGVNQEAHGYIADNAVVNSGFIGGAAIAIGGTYVHAYSASARAYGVDQHAYGYTAHNTVGNNVGTIAAYAYASDANEVHAEAKAINQYADLPESYLAQNVVDNTAGFIYASAYAFDALVSHYAYGTAEARAYGIDQHASAPLALNSVVNHGTRTAYGKFAGGIIAAYASASNGVDVRAEAKGIDQHADGVYATNVVYNDGGVIAATAIAHNAVGYASVQISIVYHLHTPTGGAPYSTQQSNTFTNYTPGHADARATGVDQHAHGDPALNFVYNSGLIVAFASASNANGVFAEAKGVNQDAHGYSAVNIVDNSGTIEAIAVAHSARGFTNVAHYGSTVSGAAYTSSVYYPGVANARAIGVDQRAHGFTAYNEVVNAGAIEAFASAYNATEARAYAAGISQEAHGYNAVNFVSNYHGMVLGSAYAGYATTADARAYGIRQDAGAFDAHNTVVNHGSVTASGAHNGVIEAIAIASYATFAHADAKAIDQQAHGYTAHNSVVNDGGLILASAYAHGTVSSFADYADAHADGIDQHAHGYHAENVVFNSGAIIANATASFAYDKANAEAKGINQDAHGYSAINGVLNGGFVGAFASAYDAFSGSARAVGIDQHAGGYSAANIVFNDGGIVANAIASSNLFAGAQATGIDQHAEGYAAGNLVANFGGFIGAFASAPDNDLGYAEAVAVNQEVEHAYAGVNHASNFGVIVAEAHAGGYYSSADSYFIGDVAEADAAGIDQSVHARIANNTVDNYGIIVAGADAVYADYAYAEAYGIYQSAGARTAVNVAVNTWGINVQANAAGTYEAAAAAVGIDQYAGAYHAQNYVYNSGWIDARANANAYGTGDPLAEAAALGIHQDFDAATAKATDINYGSIDAHAYARVHSGITQTAKALAAGIMVGETEALHSATGAPLPYARTLTLDIVNEGYIFASAVAEVAALATPSHGTAVAYGIAAVNLATGANEGIVKGKITNYGFVGAEAHAPYIAGGGQASAIGIGVEAKEFVGTIANYGTIDAQAFGSTAKAIGIGVEKNPGTAYGHKGLIVNDGGLIFASVNYGHTGTAIDVHNAPNEVDIDLEGTHQMGEIFGNIEDAHSPTSGAGGWVNAITVSGPNPTYLDGSINPELNPGSVPSLATGGTLTVNGTLWLPNASTSFWGQNPILNVASYTQPGALQLDLDGLGNNATINAVTASLSGGVVVNANPYTLFVTSATPYDIVNAGTLSGAWSSLTVTGPLSVSPLLSWSSNCLQPTPASCDTSDQADINVTRTAFNAVPGLTHNEGAVATGLENAYGYVQARQSLTSPSTAQLLYESMFLFNHTQYPQALNMLSDSQAGEVAQSNVVSVNTFDDKIADRLASVAANVGPNGQVGPTPAQGITFWGSPFGTFNNTASTASGPGYTDDRAGVTLGADTPFAADPGAVVVAGLAVNIESKGSMTFENGSWNDLVSNAGYGSSQGWDVAGYARYNASQDNDAFYFQASVSYGTYDDTTQRAVAMPVLAARTMASPPSPSRSALTPTIPSVGWESDWLTGAFTSDVWSIYGEGGLPVDLGIQNLGFTPYLGLRYIHSTSGAYNEVALTKGTVAGSAALNVSDASASSLSSYLGAEFSTTTTVADQTLLPTLRVAWAHNFDDPWQVNASFSGIGPSSAFTINGSTWSRDSGLVDFGVSTVFMDNMMATIGYDANVSGTQTVQSVYGRLDITF